MRAAFLLLIALATHASAEQIRCGVDDFGNTVCLDGNGAMTIAPAASAVPSTESTRDEEMRVRCGVDPFGNKVCR